MGLKEQRGCIPGTKATVQPLLLIGGIRYDRCPKAFLAQDCRSEMRWWSDFSWLKRNNVLPESGGKLDQGARFIEAMDIIESESEKTLAIAREKAGSGKR